MAMSEAAPSSGDAGGEAVPCPREVWARVRKGRVMTLHVQPQGGGQSITFTGEVTERRKVGDAHHAHVVIQLTPFGQLAPVEIEARRDGGPWGPFHAFHWTERMDPRYPDDHYHFQYAGVVTGLELKG